MPVISTEQLFFSYSGESVLQNVNLTVDEHEFLGIIGPNGGGKTTLLYLIMGFLKPDCGSLHILGTSPKKARTKIGWVPQNFLYDPLFPITVLEVVLMGRLSTKPWFGRYDDKDREAASQALEKMGMGNHEKTSLAELSAGQAQRVLIARALAASPELLLLDEPTSSIDMDSQEVIYGILKELKEKMTILMVTHDLRAVSHYVDRIVCVQKEVTSLSKQEVCDHFAMGVYHSPHLKDPS